MAEKIRYPSKVFKHLKKYPLRHCGACGKQLTPRLTYKQGKYPALETLAAFSARLYCNQTCYGKRHANRAQPKAKKAPLEPEIKQELRKALRRHDPDLLEVWE